MLKALLIPGIIFAVLFTPSTIIALNLSAIIGLVGYELYCGIREIFYLHHATSKAV